MTEAEKQLALLESEVDQLTAEVEALCGAMAELKGGTHDQGD